MSKTDKTRPWWVRMADAPMATCVPVHDHRFGPCTLPEEITPDSASLNHGESGCYWSSGPDYVFGTGVKGDNREWYHFRREDRRRDRHQARRALRAYRGED